MVFHPVDQATPRSDVSDRPQTITTVADKHSLVSATLAEMRLLSKGGSQADTNLPAFDLPGNVIRIDDRKESGTIDKTPPGNVIRIDDGPIDRTRPDDGMIGLPEETPSFKAYERLTAKFEKEFPGKENEELRSAALAYSMDREGFHNYKPSLAQLVTLIQSGKLEALKDN